MANFVISHLEIKYLEKKKTTFSQNRNSMSSNIQIMDALGSLFSFLFATYSEK